MTAHARTDGTSDAPDSGAPAPPGTDGTREPGGAAAAVGATAAPDGPEAARPARTDTAPREEEIERSFDRIMEEGRPRLERVWLDMVATGTVGGLEVGFGVLALLAVEQQTHSMLLGGLAFSVGFIGLLLGQSELFTEGFLVPVTVVAAGEARLRDLLRLWCGTLAGNLAGGWVIAWIVTAAFPSLHAQAITSASYYVEAGTGTRSFCLAVLAGAAITLLTRMHQGTDSDGAKVVASVAIAFVLAGVRLFHSVLDSLLAFAALDTGHAPFGYLDWLRFFGWVVLGNLVGGLGLTTLLRLVRSRSRLVDHRIANDRPVPALAARRSLRPGGRRRPSARRDAPSPVPAPDGPTAARRP